jgi:hypothetical protein
VRIAQIMCPNGLRTFLAVNNVQVASVVAHFAGEKAACLRFQFETGLNVLPTDLVLTPYY